MNSSNLTCPITQTPITQSDIKAKLAYDLWSKFNPVQVDHLLEAVKSLQPGDDQAAFIATLKHDVALLA
jgi:hypothetical protein